MIQVYVYDRKENLFYPMSEAYAGPPNFVVIGPVNPRGPSQGEFEYYLIQKGWPAGTPFPKLDEDPIPF